MAAERTDNEIQFSNGEIQTYALALWSGFFVDEVLMIMNEMRKAKMNKKTGFTLMELVVIVVILGILVGIAVPVYQKTILRAKIKAAETGLRAIYAAEKIYFMKNSTYYANGDVNQINSTLYLDLAETDWNYTALDSVNWLGQADILPANNIGFRIGESPVPGCTGSISGEPCCYKGCTLF